MKVRDEPFRYYFYFIQERMKIFWRRYEGAEYLTDDPILAKHKFTNVYRAQDRVSQYLIRHVIYEKEQQFSDVDNLLIIIIFEIFDNINTWEYFKHRLEEISIKTFDVDSP